MDLTPTPTETTPPEFQPLRNGCIHHLFESQAAQTPNAVAVCCGEEKLTYRQLNERANQLAHYLQTLGVGPEVPVALCLERSLHLLVAILGVLKAGGIYVPVDLAYPRERVSFMLEDTRAPVLLTQEHLRAVLPAKTARVVCLDSSADVFSTASTANPVTQTTGENAAYIIFTSGSTGRPKGVLVTHHNVVRLFQQTQPWYGFNGSDVWTLFHSCAFDFSVWEIWGALFHGGRLVVVPYSISRSPAALYELLLREQVTVLNQTPSAFRQLLWAEAAAETALPLRLRYVIFGGEALELQSLKPWFDRHGDEKPLLVNMYGITETTVHVTFRPIRRADLANGLGSVIGVPIPDLQIHLLDENLKPVPAGAPGEICVGGEGVARGYLNRPELTRQRFLHDPFSNRPGARLYRSGDLAQYTATGELEYLGRMDHQVKIRGFRIELGEIESALNQYPGIRESVVVAQEDAEAEKRLVAYVVPVAEPPTVSALRESLGQRLPDYMLPAVFVFLDSLPLTTSGKVDRKALPKPDRARPELKNEFVAPRDDREQRLAEIWSAVLRIEQVGIQDNFFDLGGDSIQSIKMLAQAQQCGFNLSLQQLFQNPTIAALAACADASSPKTVFQPALPFSLLGAEDRAKLPVDIEDAYPLTRLQLGMFYHNELDPVSAIYHDVFSFRFHSAFDRDLLARAILGMSARHPLLRTSFHLAGFSEPLQLVHRQVNVPLTVQDLRALSPHDQEQQLVQWLETEKRRPFDRTQAPLLRFHIQWLSDRAFQFIASFHHVCLDGWSLAAMMTEIFQDYASLRKGTRAVQAAPRIAYRDFVALEKSAIASPECRGFWTEKLSGATFQKLPRWPRSLCAGGHEQVRGPELPIDPATFAGLKSLARKAGVPLKTVLLAAHQRVMGLLYGQTDVTSGLVCNGRPEELDGEKILGLFLNTLPLRQQLNGGTWIDLVRQTFAAEQELLPYRRFPLAEVQKLHGNQMLFEAAFDFVHFHVYQNLQGYEDMGFMEGHYFEANNLTTYTTFMLDVTSTQLQMHIDYDPNALTRPQIEEISHYYLKTLQTMASDSHCRYEAFSPLSDTEVKRLLAEWNATQEEYPRSDCIHQLFEARARETPGATAVGFEDQELTYGELNTRADELASRLAALGVGPEVLVGICIERSPEMIVGLLGILKAGGAYVPLDPAYPRERLALMLEDSQPRVLLTQKSLLPVLPQSRAQTLCVDEIAPALGTAPGVRPVLPNPQSTNLAYVLYTSGSTGKPKGVQVLHRAVVNLLTSAAAKTGLTAKDNLLAVTTLSFDIAAMELFLPLILGAQVTLASREKAADGTHLATLMASSDATAMQATPATWKMLLEAGWSGNKNMKLFSGGEALPRALADALLERAKELWNFYGPTETTIWSTVCQVLPEEPISIGRPLANTQLYILDARLQPVPIGTAGQLYIGGDGLARGYLNRPELTAQKFIPNPFGRAGQRLYSTGDLARYWPDGRVECLGRIDHQVKIRGFRIELGEVESVLRQHAGIADALVTAREDALGEKRLVGYIVSKNGPPAAAELREFMKTRLPLFMVPAHFVTLPQLPRTPNGKIDLRLLPAPETSAPPAAAFVAPRDHEEQQLAEIWQGVLGLQRVGMTDNFFEIGADSLSATRAYARINQLFGTAIRLQDIFDHPTLGSLAEFVRQHKGKPRVEKPILPRQLRPRQTA